MNLGKTGMRSLAFLYSAMFLLSAPGWTQSATSSPGIYGTWYTYPPGNPNTDAIHHEFRHDSATNQDEMVVIRVCTAESRVVTAKAVSPIEVSEDTIRVLKSASASEPIEGTTVCQASITAGTFAYSFSEEDDHLILTNPGGNPDYMELTRTAPESGAAAQRRLYGTWLLPPVDGKEMRVQIRWVLYTTAEHQDKIRQIAVCSKGNDSLVSHVDSEITLTKDNIKVLHSASHEQKEGTFSCLASITAFTWHYTLAPNGATLTLSAAGAKPMTLTREEQPGLNY